MYATRVAETPKPEHVLRVCCGIYRCICQACPYCSPPTPTPAPPPPPTPTPASTPACLAFLE